MPDQKSSAEYLAIGEKLKAAEFRGMVVTKLKYIETSLNGLGEVDKEHSKRIVTLERFQSNIAGKFAVIGAVLIVVVNWAWDLGSNAIKSLKGN